jgi:NDP-sugar pyrophosphorylase family protein
MKVIILADGFETRLAEEANLRPNQMIGIGGLRLRLHIRLAGRLE